MTTSIEFDAVSNSWDEQPAAGEHQAPAGVQVAQAAGNQPAGEPVPVDVGSGAPAKGDGNAENAQGAGKPAASANAPAANAPTANAAASNVPHEYHAEAGNIVKLPANVSIDNIKVEGHNLVLQQPDGSEIVIKDGALNVPTFIIGDVEVPRVALIAALEASHVDVAFGADGSISAGGNGSPSSAGGNFEQPPGGIGDGFGLTALLPPTDLAFGQPEHRELFPGLEKPDSIPTILDLTPSVDGGDTVVNEKGLETAGATGSGEAGTDPAVDNDTSEHNTGTFTINSPDGIGKLTINGTDISGADLANSANAHVNVTTPDGNTLTITGYNSATGEVSYTYTLEHSEQHPAGDGNNSIFDNMTVTVTDTDGDVSAPGTLSVKITDDVPTANPDTDSVAAGQYSADGNVITAANTTTQVPGVDVLGADGATVAGVAAGTGGNLDDATTVNAVIHGTYGDLVLQANGDYTYTRNAGTPGGVDDTFTYTLKDGDGDLSHTTLTIHIDDSGVTSNVPAAGAAGALVSEAGLPPHGTLPAGSGEIADGLPNNNSDHSETTAGSITYTAPDGPATVTIGGVAVTAVNQTFQGTYGTLTITSIANGTVGYSYTLTTNTVGDTTHDDFAVVVTDKDGDHSDKTLTINITDDVPTANPDTDSVAAGQYSADGNVITAANTTTQVPGVDVLGADGATVAGVAAGTGGNLDDATTVNAVIHGTYGDLVLQANGDYTYTRNAGTPGGVDDTFTYTLKDGDGDLSHTTLTIHIDDSGVTSNVPAAGAAGALVSEAGLPPYGTLPAGSGEIADGLPNNNSDHSETTAGSITYTAPDGPATVTIGGVAVTAVNQTFQGTYGTLTITSIANGTVGYSYTLTTNTVGDTTHDDFAVVVTDKDGDHSDKTLTINITDDVPTANPDTDSVAAGQYSADGNVITAANTTTQVPGVDVLGADGATVAGVAAGTGGNLDDATTVNAVIHGTYGDLVLQANGDYTYTRNAGTPGGVDDTFTYTLKDGDGDLSHTTLTIHIDDSGVTSNVPAAGAAGALVSEAGLPPHGTLPAGSGEIADGLPNNNSDHSETTAGSITYTAPDGPATVTIGGVAVTAVNQTFQGTYGTLTITSIANGTVGYSYTLTTNTVGDTTHDDFAVVVTDKDGDHSDKTLTINITDDVPTANPDTDSVAAGQYSADGNVITAANTTTQVPGVDVLGADGATVAGVAAGTGGNLDDATTVNAVIHGTYGDLVLQANGDYTYTRNAGTPGGVDDTFTYTLKDGDGDLSHTTLTIHIDDSGVTSNVPAAGAAGALVSEAGLPPHGTLPAGSGEIADGLPNNNSDHSETTAGSITYTAPDGPATVTIGGVAVTAVNQTFQGTYGTLTITSIANGTVGYSYTLTTNTVGDTTHDDFAVVVTDKDGDHSDKTLTINITDDVPTANPDTDSVAAGQYSADGNVITAANTTTQVPGVDVLGADGATVAGVAAGTGGNLDDATTVNAVIHGTYGDLVLQANGDYTYTRNAGTPGGVDDTFTYTLKDGDGDLSHTTLTIHIDDSGVTSNVPAAGAAGALVSEAGLPPYGTLPAGSGEIADGLPNNNSDHSETTAGSITYTAPDGPATVTIGGVAVTAVNQTFQGTYGTLTITSIANGTVGYSYTLTTNTVGDTTHDDFAVVVTDKDGDHSDKTLTINITDDVPTANPDTDSVAAGQYSADGNVITAANTTTQVPGVDVLGADGATVAGVAAGTGGNLDDATTVNAVIHGTYGDLVLQANGDYTYTRNAGTPGGVDDTFTYTLKDGDGDLSHTTLTIHIDDSGVTSNVPAAGAAGALVSEAGLPPHGTLPAGSGEIADGLPNNNSDHSETTAGSITYTAPDGPATVTIGGVAVTAVNQTFQGTYGTLTITSIANGTVGYSYTLTTNTVGDTTHDDFAVVVTDKDGDHSDKTLTINITDDVPTANPDTDSVAAGQYSADGNVITAANTTTQVPGVDVLGADGATVAGVAAGTGGNLDDATTVNAVIHGTYGDLVLQANGDYTYTRNAGTPGGVDDTFTYTLKDGDGDLSHTTLTIHIDDSGVTSNVPAAGAAGALVSEAGLPPHGTLPAGSGEIADGLPNNNSDHSETTAGSITYTAPDGPATVTIGGVAVTAVNQTFQGTYGTLTITSIANGTVGYSYTLTTNTVGDTTHDDFAVVVTDKDGDHSDKTLTINITDDVPTAHDDTWVPAITGPTTLTGLLSNDVFGADGVATTTPGVITTTNGTHGTVVYNNDGTFTYTPTGVYVGSDTFTYTIKDGDGDTSTATVTVNVNTNTVPTGGGTASLTVNEAALDTTLDLTAPADLQAGVVTGTDPSSRGETAQATSGITFNATGEAINVAFANPTGDPNWVVPTVNGLAAGYSISWALVGNQLVGTLMHGATNLGPSIYLALSNTSAGANSSLTPVVTATLTDQLQHVAGSGNITINGLQVVATDTSGDHVSGAVNLTVLDDVPRGFVGDGINLPDSVHTPLTEHLNFAPGAGADGVGNVVFSVTEGAPVTDANGANVFLNGEQLFYHISADSHTVQGVTSAANGSDLGFTATLDPATDTWSFTLNGTIFNGAEFTTQNATATGGNNPVNAFTALTNPDTPNDLLVTANGANTVNTSQGNFGVGSGQSIASGETIRFDFVTNAHTDGTVAGSGYTTHYEVSSFTQGITKTTPGNGTVDLTIRAVNANDNMSFVGDAGDTTAVGVIVTFTNGSGGAAPTLVDNHDGTYTLQGMAQGDTFTVSATSDPFSAVEVTGASSSTFKLGAASFSTANATDPFDIKIPVTGTDGDGDNAAGSVTAHLYPTSSTLEGTSGIDALTATATKTTLTGQDGNDTLTGINGHDTILAGGQGNDTLTGMDGNDKLYGGSGDDTLIGGAGNDLLVGGSGFNHMTGGAGNDTFVIDPSKLSVHIADVIADYTPGQDVIDLSDLLKTLGANAPTTDAQAGTSIDVTFSGGAAHVMVDNNGTAAGGSMVEVASLTGVAAGSAITILYDHNQPTHTETVT